MTLKKGGGRYVWDPVRGHKRGGGRESGSHKAGHAEAGVGVAPSKPDLKDAAADPAAPDEPPMRLKDVNAWTYWAQRRIRELEAELAEQVERTDHDAARAERAEARVKELREEDRG